MRITRIALYGVSHPHGKIRVIRVIRGLKISTGYNRRFLSSQCQMSHRFSLAVLLARHTALVVVGVA
jgi:hypothetical protein